MTAVAVAAPLYAPAPQAPAPQAPAPQAPAPQDLAPYSRAHAPLTPVAPQRAIPAAYVKRGPLGDPTPLVCTVAKAALDIALGANGIDRLARWITPTLRTTLLRQQSLSRRAKYTARGQVSVARVRLCRVSATAVEAAVVATEGDVAHALAMRLEAVSGRWLVTALDVG
ncbi:Rv3235 family protein [Demequina lutea]|uniref:Uncharacterized protein n=2 Tax=Demequina lutea TaxID=431489 RepID=A0A7Y9Z8M4_9MICO|nr:Rv3235 family protein [Demequina lutea]NYI40804.1 hypothetical protein [Demequina lutea]